MTGRLVIALVGSVGFAVSAIAAYVHLRHPWPWARAVLRLAVAIAVGVNVVFLAHGIRVEGATETLEHNFEAAVLLATLIALTGIGTHLSPALRGLDSFLLVVAAASQLGSLTVMHKPDPVFTGRPWFISHGLAFALSATFFVAGGAAGVAYLLVNHMIRRKAASAVLGNVASLEALERFGRWMPIMGFPLFTYGILTGLCGVWHRDDIGRTTWYLDLTFVSSLAAWLVYAYLSYCLMCRPRIRGRQAATLATCGLGLIVIVLVFKEFLSPMHQ